MCGAGIVVAVEYNALASAAAAAAATHSTDHSAENHSMRDAKSSPVVT